MLVEHMGKCLKGKSSLLILTNHLSDGPITDRMDPSKMPLFLAEEVMVVSFESHNY